MLNLSVGKNRRGKSTFDARPWWRAMALILIPWKMRAPRGSKAPRRAGGSDKKKKAGERWRGPILCLIESSFRTVGTSLKNQGVFCRYKKKRKKKRATCSELHHHRTESPKSLFVLSQPQGTQARLWEKMGPQILVIYDNCFLRKCKCDDYFSSVARHSLLWRLVRRGGLKNCRGTMRMTPKTGAELSAVSKQLYFHTWMRADTHSGKPQWLHSQNNLGSLFFSFFFPVHWSAFTCERGFYPVSVWYPKRLSVQDLAPSNGKIATCKQC